ncbi:protein-tyrosine phosphatase-like protein [Cercophora newfieldiana]|uniref:protein-tyrosine-phosphatase n=1 Tax=Cercophora newfieldiana TaxID=92897 RepID=A0AA39YBJ7_9PEZI|nr:protein-tyrosine phosphatase-like protein [Cercophora newfieldiana]
MALNRINGREELYVGGVFGLRRSQLIKEHKITHILSVIKYYLRAEEDVFRGIEHLSVDVDDMEDEDLLVYFPKMVRFIEKGLYGEVKEITPAGLQPSGSKSADDEDADAITPAADSAELTAAQLARLKLTPAASSSSPSSRGPAGPEPTGAVFVHCAMGKSRSVSAIIAWLLWKHPHRFGRSNPTTTPRQAVANALKWVRDSRPIAEPNDGFMSQLEMWWDMGCPADSDDAVEREPAYQRWLYKREVEDAARVGRAPDWIRFEDEEAEKDEEKPATESAVELRCKKCRRVLVTQPFIVPHQGRGNAERSDCPHVFIEALSWMRLTLEAGELEGRLACPNAKCGASVGRYAWQGFKCSCGDWVAPAISLQKSKVDEVKTTSGGGKNSAAQVGSAADRMAALGIRMPPGGGRQENL